MPINIYPYIHLEESHMPTSNIPSPVFSSAQQRHHLECELVSNSRSASQTTSFVDFSVSVLHKKEVQNEPRSRRRPTEPVPEGPEGEHKLCIPHLES